MSNVSKLIRRVGAIVLALRCAAELSTRDALGIDDVMTMWRACRRRAQRCAIRCGLMTIASRLWCPLLVGLHELPDGGVDGDALCQVVSARIERACARIPSGCRERARQDVVQLVMG